MTGAWPWRDSRKGGEPGVGWGRSGQAAGRGDQSWAPEDGETAQWGDGKGAPGPGNDLSKGSEVGSSPVCTEDGKGAGEQPGGRGSKQENLG